jgi:site-specific recombinase XerD
MLCSGYAVASIHRNPRSPKGVWYCAYTLADGRRAYRSTGKRNKAEAKIICDALAQAESEAATGDLTKARLEMLFNETLTRLGHNPIERVSVKDWFDSWLASKQRIAPTTLSGYKQALAEFLEHLGSSGVHRRLESISERDIEGFLRQLRKDGRAPSTINKLVRKHLSAVFEKARKLGKIRYNPVAATEPEKNEFSTKGTFTGEQIAALLRVADSDWQGMILFAYSTGARLSDCKCLKWSNLDVANGIVTFREQKTKTQAVIGLHSDFLDWLVAQPVPNNPDAPVFPKLAVQPVRDLSSAFTKLCDTAGIEKRLLRHGNDGKGRSVRALSFHSFRHTAASNVFNQATLREITRRVTGHAAGGAVDQYIHSDLEAIRAAVALIPRLPRK